MRCLRNTVACVLVLAGASGCAATPRPGIDIGMARVGLALAFKEDALAPAVTPEVIIRLLPAPPSPEQASEMAPPATIAPQLCPAATADAAPDAPAPLAIVSPPAAGRYTRINTGTVKVQSGPLVFTVPYPTTTTMDVRNVEVTTVDAVPGVPAAGTSTFTSFDVVESVLPGSESTERYQFDAATLSLVATTVTNNGMTTTNTFSPPVKIYDFRGVGQSWTSVGADAEARKALAVQGSTRATEVVDVCGTVIDTMRVESTSTLGDLQTGGTSGTTPGATDVSDIATQLGGLFARRELHRTEVVEIDGNQVVLTYDVISTLANLTPEEPS